MLELVISFYARYIGCITGKGREILCSVKAGRIGSGIYNWIGGNYRKGGCHELVGPGLEPKTIIVYVYCGVEFSESMCGNLDKNWGKGKK